MICKFCGNELADDAVFCGHCGQRVEGEVIVEPVAAAEETVYETPARKKQRSKHATSILVMAIISLVFVAVVLIFTCGAAIPFFMDDLSRGEMRFKIALLGILLPIAIVAVILSSLSGTKVKNHKKTFGDLNGVAKAGKAISILTRILSIANLVLQVVLIVWMTFDIYF